MIADETTQPTKETTDTAGERDEALVAFVLNNCILEIDGLVKRPTVKEYVKCFNRKWAAR